MNKISDSSTMISHSTASITSVHSGAVRRNIEPVQPIDPFEALQGITTVGPPSTETNYDIDTQSLDNPYDDIISSLPENTNEIPFRTAYGNINKQDVQANESIHM